MSPSIDGRGSLGQNSPLRKLRIFVASPSDVNAERAAAKRVLDRLGRQFRGQIEIEEFLWEDSSYEAASTFQEQIPRPSKFDIVVLLLWSKLGSPTTVDNVVYRSATEFEFLDARRNPQTRLMVYRKIAQLPLDRASRSCW